MSIVDHPMWLQLCAAIRIEPYNRDWAAGKPMPRVRIWAVPVKGLPVEALLSVRMACVSCGREIACFRQSRRKSKLHFSPTCEQRVSLVCSRQPAARDEYKRVVEAMGGIPAQMLQPLQSKEQPHELWVLVKHAFGVARDLGYFTSEAKAREAWEVVRYQSMFDITCERRKLDVVLA